MGISIILATSGADHGIGHGMVIPWRIRKDMEYFKRITSMVDAEDVERGARQNAVIMGVRTWNSIPPKFRPLPSRLNVVIASNSRIDDPLPDLTFTSLELAVEALRRDKTIGEIFVCGGKRLYEEALSLPVTSIAHCDCIYLTRISRCNGKPDFECDVAVPMLGKVLVTSDGGSENFKLVFESNVQSAREPGDTPDTEYQFFCYERNE